MLQKYMKMTKQKVIIELGKSVYSLSGWRVGKAVLRYIPLLLTG